MHPHPEKWGSTARSGFDSGRAASPGAQSERSAGGIPKADGRCATSVPGEARLDDHEPLYKRINRLTVIPGSSTGTDQEILPRGVRASSLWRRAGILTYRSADPTWNTIRRTSSFERAFTLISHRTRMRYNPAKEPVSLRESPQGMYLGAAKASGRGHPVPQRKRSAEQWEAEEPRVLSGSGLQRGGLRSARCRIE